MILVTGGSGFIGSNFISSLLSNGYRNIINLDILSYASHSLLNTEEQAPRHDIVKFIRGDIADRKLVKEILQNSNIQWIINFAAESHVDRSIQSPGAFIQTNIVGTFSLLEEVRLYFRTLTEEQKKSFRFLHISTDEVYGSLLPGSPPFTELHTYQPNSPYSASKAASDHLVRAYHHTYDIPVLTTNCSNNYGSYQYPEKLIPLCIHNALAGKPLPIYGDGNQVRDWLYVEDHCTAIQRVLEAGLPGQVYNIGGWNEKTNLEVVSTLCAILDDKAPRADRRSYIEQITFVKDRPGHDRRYAIDATKIERELGWRPKETFETGIRKTVRWYLDNQDWVTNITSGTYRKWIDMQYADN